MTDGSVLRPELPEFDLPCLSFIWEIAAPSGWKATDCGAGLIANDRDDPADWPCGALGLWSPAWNSLRGRAASDGRESARHARWSALPGELG